MAPHRPTYELVAEAAKTLTARGNSPFKLDTLIAAVQRIDPARHRESIQPAIPGMTINAGKGPASPIGKLLVRVEHGYYELVSTERRKAELHATIARLDAETEGSGHYLPTTERWPSRIASIQAEGREFVERCELAGLFVAFWRCLSLCGWRAGARR